MCHRELQIIKINAFSSCSKFIIFSPTDAIFPEALALIRSDERRSSFVDATLVICSTAYHLPKQANVRQRFSCGAQSTLCCILEFSMSLLQIACILASPSFFSILKSFGSFKLQSSAVISCTMARSCLILAFTLALTLAIAHGKKICNTHLSFIFSTASFVRQLLTTFACLLIIRLCSTYR